MARKIVVVTALLTAAAACEGYSATPPPVPSPYQGIECADTVCNHGNVCCLERVGVQFKQRCLQADATCGGVAFPCDGPEDCGIGERCCVYDLEMDDKMPQCAASCEGGAEMCHTAADCSDPAADCINKEAALGFNGYGICFDA
ncbi:MAG: hypothetical protein EXR75_02935 [Myxococcales bacterium]|nr:hypothetical protein [Myxococcales bacterium]